MAAATIKAQTRNEFGQGPNRRLRAAGQVPGVIYQAGGPSLPIAADGHELWMLLGQGSGRRQVVEIAVADGPAVPVVFVEWQLDPVRGDIRHVDFKQIEPSQVDAENARLAREAEARAAFRQDQLDRAAKSRREAAAAEAAAEGEAPADGEVTPAGDDGDVIEADDGSSQDGE